MPLQEDIDAAWKDMLQNYPDGISSTSTKKYEPLVEVVANALGLEPDQVYATGSNTRPSNLDTRWGQGNKRGQHTPLGIAFQGVQTHGQTHEDAIERVSSSVLSTSTKFVTGEEYGTNYDGILHFGQVDEGDRLVPLNFLYNENCSYADKVVEQLPDIETKRVTWEGRAVQENEDWEVKDLVIGADAAAACEATLAAAGLRLPPGLLRRFLAALLVKRFVILTGLSGSGKTAMAVAVARWLTENKSQWKLVAVGADWDTGENLLGYRDALAPDRYHRPANGALDLLLAAAEEPGKPHFLILDEMNLSHVERYFADFLSAIESGEPIALHSGSSSIQGVPHQFFLPGNLFIIGTVNVDETTYMFSPKVLDRANVLEFRPSRLDIAGFLESPMPLDLTKVDGRGSGAAPEFVKAASTEGLTVRNLSENYGDPEELHSSLTTLLLELFDELKSVGAEFGFRSAGEILRFTYFHALLCGDSWTLQRSLDAQVLQKLLPRLHGSERRLRPVLNSLQSFCTANELPSSNEKIERMTERLVDGFTSFAEA